MKSSRLEKRRNPRRGAILVLFALLLVVILGMVACALDVGWIVMTRTQLQAAADASALAAGTELLSGLGYQPARTPTQVVAAGTPVAVDFASRHRNGDVASSFADGARDVQYGWATFTADTVTPGAGTWAFDTGGQAVTGWYNAARVTLHRDVAASTNADYPLPLILAPVLGSDKSDVTARATVIILPAKGFTIEPGSNETANLLPFALHDQFWKKYQRAQEYFDDQYVDLNTMATLQTILDTDGTPLFGHLQPAQNTADDLADGVADGLAFRQDFTDNWTAASGTEPDTSTPSPGPDTILELDAYPHDFSPGNFGTVDLGWAGNSTDTLNRQIVDGINETDLANLGLAPGEEFTLSRVPTVTGDTGISVGMKAALDQILGQCRAMLLFDAVSDPGNNATFYLNDFAGIRVMDVQLTGSDEIKNITIQLCKFQMPGAVGDLDDTIGEDTTVFTPLMLIE